MPDYAPKGYVLFAESLLRQAVEPMEEEAFWELVAWLGWPGDGESRAHERLAARLAARLDLAALAAAAAAAQDFRDEVEAELVDDALWELIPSEDGMDDFCWHVVGLGKAMVTGLADDPGPALAIARDHAFVESFRYVFQTAFGRYTAADYHDLLTRLFAPVPLADTRTVRADTVFVLDNGQLAIVIRVDEGSLVVATPTGDRRIPWPG